MVGDWVQWNGSVMGGEMLRRGVECDHELVRGRVSGDGMLGGECQQGYGWL